MSNQPPPSQGASRIAVGANPFVEDVNPYAAPREVGYDPQLTIGQPFTGLWRQGDMLVIHKCAPLPDICLKSNKPATRRLKRSLSWHHPAVFLLLLISPLIYIIVALILRKSATLNIPLTDAWHGRRRRRMLFAWVAALLSGLLFFSGLGYLDEPSAVWVLVFGIVVCVSATFYGVLGCRLVYPHRITDQYVWVRGVHPGFLDRLEAWQWNI
jgi:hypothetical protein